VASSSEHDTETSDSIKAEQLSVSQEGVCDQLPKRLTMFLIGTLYTIRFETFTAAIFHTEVFWVVTM
jgi:hypothetical protein